MKTMKATSVLAAKNLIVARRSPSKHRSKDANTPVRSVQTLCGWVGPRVRWAGWLGGEGRGAERAADVLLLRSFPRRSEELRYCSGALSLAVCSSAQSPPFIRAGRGAACCSDVGSVCAFQNSQTSQECGWRGLLPSPSPGSVAPSPSPPPFFFGPGPKKTVFGFSTLNNDLY